MRAEDSTQMTAEDSTLRRALEQLNRELGTRGMPGIDIVHPGDCIPQQVNARYMDQQMLDVLASNLSRDNRLESVPLVAPSRQHDGRYEIISGHHRVEAAQKAGLERIMVMVVTVENMEELRAKQLSHNAITGKDDEVLLKKMYESIQDLSLKIYSGLQDQLDSINIVSLNFRAGSFREFTVAFLPADVEDYDTAVDVIQDMTLKGSSEVRTGNREDYDLFARVIRDVKKVENIKSNGAALSRMTELALERVGQIKDERREEKEEQEDEPDA